MSRSAKFNVGQYLQQIDLPSKQAARVEKFDGGERLVSLTPFADLRDAEEALMVKLALEAGMKFRILADNLQHNVALGDADYIATLLRERYQTYKEDGWFNGNFDPGGAVEQLKQSSQGAIQKLSEERARRHEIAARGSSRRSGGNAGAHR